MLSARASAKPFSPSFDYADALWLFEGAAPGLPVTLPPENFYSKKYLSISSEFLKILSEENGEYDPVR